MAGVVNRLALAPLGAGDLIDRAVRLYRHHFATLIRIAVPPAFVSALGSVLWTVGWREFSLTSSETSLALYFALLAIGLALLVCGIVFHLVVMGGATRNLVTHLLWNEPVSARATYRNVRARFWGLLGASLLVGAIVGVIAVMVAYGWLMLVGVIVMVASLLAIGSGGAWIAAFVGIVSSIAATVGAMWLFFLLAGRFVYVPQVMLVEGKGVIASLSRSSALANGNARRLMAMTLFTTFATYSALMILAVPLGWYGYLNGISLWNTVNWPAWYAIFYNVLAQASSILLMPVWMLGLSLLYVDERVRHEGYDIELMAARQLGAMPNLSGGHSSPFAPAIVAEQAATRRTAVAPKPEALSPNSVLGLR